MTSMFGLHGQRVLALITCIQGLSADQVDQVTSARATCQPPGPGSTPVGGGCRRTRPRLGHLAEIDVALGAYEAAIGRLRPLASPSGRPRVRGQAHLRPAPAAAEGEVTEIRASRSAVHPG
jgi:hypothetical protein